MCKMCDKLINVAITSGKFQETLVLSDQVTNMHKLGLERR